MKKNSLISNLTVFAATAALSTAAFAGPSTPSQARGYAKCVDAAQAQSRGLATQRNYLFSRDGNRSQYYINASRWQDNGRVAVRISCLTSANGHMLVSQEISEGRFVRKQTQPAINVADR